MEPAEAFWPFENAAKHAAPAFYLQPPQENLDFVYGVGRGSSFLEAKIKALDDLATQLSSRVHVITSVHKQSDDPTEVKQHITILTHRDIADYEIVQEAVAEEIVYLLLRHRKDGKE